MKKVTVTLYLDKRRALKNGTFPVKLRITFQRVQKYCSTPFKLTAQEFEDAYLNPKKKFTDIRLGLAAIEKKAYEVIEKMPFFDFEEFDKRFGQTASRTDVFDAYDNIIEKLTQEGRVGTASSYTCSRNSILAFLRQERLTKKKSFTKQYSQERKALNQNKPSLPFQSVTVGFLNEYATWMKSCGREKSTIGIYLRPLKALFNSAIASNDIPSECLPFGKNKFVIPAGRNSKRPLSAIEVSKIINYQPLTEGERKGRDYWLFSFYCNGINMKDIARLRYNQIADNIITFERAKTENTSHREPNIVRVFILPEIKSIIEYWGNKPKNPSSYVFPILTEGLSPIQEMAKVGAAIKAVNKYIKKIAKALEIDKPVSFYFARHSFATIQSQRGTTILQISQALGHSNEKTTRNYIGNMEIETLRKNALKLTRLEEIH